VTSPLHDTLVRLFEDCPALSLTLLRDVLGVALPEHTGLSVDELTVKDPAPAGYHADQVVLLERAGQAVLGIVVEVQLSRQSHKRYSWPMYAVGLRSRKHCPCCVLVITPDAAVARWASRPIVVGPGCTFTPQVVPPASVPVITDESEAKRMPELSILSALAHAEAPPKVAARIAQTALVACAGLDDERAVVYSDVLLAALSATARKELEQMFPEGYVFQSDLALLNQARGKAEGLAEGKAEGVLRVLEARGVSVTEEQRQRILGCRDLEQLDRWLVRAVTASAAADVFID
jgi:hypothetical protein